MNYFFGFVGGALLGSGLMVLPTVTAAPQPAPICIACNFVNNSFGNTNNCIGQLAESSNCNLNASGSACDLSGIVTFTANGAGLWNAVNSYYGTPCPGGICYTVPSNASGVALGVGLNHASGQWSSVGCNPSPVSAWMNIAPAGSCSQPLAAYKNWSCDPV